MKGVVLCLAAALLAAVIQTAVLPRLLPVWLRPDLFVILVVILAVATHQLRAAMLAWLIGATKDVFSASTLGLYAAVLLVVFLVIKSSERRLNTESSLLIMALVMVAMLLQEALAALLLLMLADAGGSWREALRHLPTQVLITGLSSYALLKLVRLIEARGGYRLPLANWRYLDKRYEP